ncbi:MAG: DUF6438 domain-containing protein [Bacteroidota bacterium]
MKYLFAILMALALFPACKNSSQGGNSKVPADFMIELRHVGCRGTCPDYKMSVDAKGNAKWYGHHAVEQMGNYSKSVDAKTVKAIVQTLNEYKFWDFEEVYGGGVADLPSIRTKVTMNGKTKQIEDIRNAPKPLKEMEAKLENLIGVDGWTKDKE